MPNGTPHVVVSISLSSGFSFQVNAELCCILQEGGFNLVIERLLISGHRVRGGLQIAFQVSISLSSGFSFQGHIR